MVHDLLEELRQRFRAPEAQDHLRELSIHGQEGEGGVPDAQAEFKGITA